MLHVMKMFVKSNQLIVELRTYLVTDISTIYFMLISLLSLQCSSFCISVTHKINRGLCLVGG